MKISDEYLVQKLLERFRTLTEVATRLGYSGYRPFRTAFKKGLPEVKRELGMRILLEDSSEKE